MGQYEIDSRVAKVLRLSKREQLAVLEIGRDEIDSASSFVSYISEAYGISKSSVWYSLNRLKEHDLVDFATKDDPGKGLALTREGLHELMEMEKIGMKLADFEVYVQHAGYSGVDVSAVSQGSRLRNLALVTPTG